MTVILSLIAIFFTLVNFLYLFSKDRLQKSENERKECLSVLKDCFSKTINKYEGSYGELTSNIESLSYLNIIKLNNLEKHIAEFAIKVTDFKEGSIQEEDIIGAYKTLIEIIYNAEISFKNYVIMHWASKKDFF